MDRRWIGGVAKACRSGEGMEECRGGGGGVPRAWRSGEAIESPSTDHRKSMEKLSKIFRTSIENLSDIYRTSIEHLSEIYAGMSILTCNLNSAGCFLGGVCGSFLNV